MIKITAYLDNYERDDSQFKDAKPIEFVITNEDLEGLAKMKGLLNSGENIVEFEIDK